MAEIRFPEPSAMAVFDLETKLLDPPRLRLELTPRLKKESIEAADLLREHVGADGKIRHVEMAEAFIPHIVKHVIGWDLTRDGLPIPCEPDTRGRWLEPLLWDMVKVGEGGPEAEGGADEEPGLRWLWVAILDFINDEDNFLKN